MSFFATFWAVFLAVSLNKIAEMLFNKWVRHHAEKGVNHLDSLLTRKEEEHVL